MDNPSSNENQSPEIPFNPSRNFYIPTQIEDNNDNTINFNENNSINNSNNNDTLFKCEYCEKTYLSTTALRNHMFNKHNNILASKNIIKQKAGRPRLVADDDNSCYNYMRNKYAKFWAVLKRKKDSNAIINIDGVLNNVFNELYNKYGYLLKNGKNIKSWKEHPWLKLLINSNNCDINNLNIIVNDNNNNKNNFTCDSVLKNYVDYVKEKTNENYLVFIIKFLVLFRECFNNSNNLRITIPLSNNIERSTVISAEQIPEIANEFFTDYLPSKKFFENSLDLNALNEMTELVQHLCYFLHLKNYSTLRLVLISKDNTDIDSKK